MVKICEVVDGCEDCPKYGDDCDGDKMTKEEAIQYLDGMKIVIPICNELKELTDERNEAIDMAIEALSTPQTDLISRADAIKGIQDGYCACVSDCIDEINKLPNMGTDCTDFIDWIRKVVADEELWELNAVGYGEIICRKLVKIGALATTEKPPYYYVPSADAVQLKQTDTLIIADALRYLAKDTERHLSDRTRADALREQILRYGASMCADAVQGEWIEKYNGNGWNDFWDYTCSACGKKYERADAVLYHANFCPNCGARMYKGGDDE